MEQQRRRFLFPFSRICDILTVKSTNTGGYIDMSKIVIMESLGISAEELALRKKPFEEAGHSFADFPRTTDIPTLVAQAKDADAMIIANMPMPGAVIRSCENLRFIDVAFTGVDHVDLAAAKEKGIAVSNASGYSNEAVAELVLGMTLSILRNLTAVENRCRAGQTKDGLVGGELKGKTVGIIGFGKIGRRSAELFHAFGCKILAQSRTHKDDAPDYVEQVLNLTYLHLPARIQPIFSDKTYA
jgi:D-3-phosphoglycerate dehydrogenase